MSRETAAEEVAAARAYTRGPSPGAWHHPFPKGEGLAAFILVIALVCAGLVGCRAKTSGKFAVWGHSVAEPVEELRFGQGWCRTDERGQVEAVLLSRESGVERMLVVRTFWRVRAARRPDRESATNANVEYVVGLEGQRTWYRGAGYVEVEELNKAGDCAVQIHSATLAPAQGEGSGAQRLRIRGSSEVRADAGQVEEALGRWREMVIKDQGMGLRGEE